MRKLILASVAVLGFAGVAAAQEAPELVYGNPNISNSGQAAPSSFDRMTTASVRHNAPKIAQDRQSSDVAGPDFNINMNDNYSGR